MVTTISELNNKPWYRALKVFNITFVIICYILAIGANFTIYYTIKDQNQYIEETTYHSPDSSYFNNEKIPLIQELKDKGYTTKQISDALKAKYGTTGFLTLTPKEYEAIYGELPSADSHPVKETTKPTSMNWLILIVPASLLLAWLISEIPKRIFYYIALGKIRPE